MYLREYQYNNIDKKCTNKRTTINENNIKINDKQKNLEVQVTVWLYPSMLF